MDSLELINQLRKLWLLDLVVRNECLQKAATQAKITRSAVSQTIGHLEKLHGRSLLIRDRGRVRPTPYCLDVLTKARPILGSLECLRPPASEDPAPAMAWLDLGAYESLAIEILPRLLKTLERRCPGCKVSVKIARSGKLATMVRRGELCMAVAVENDLMGGLTMIRLAEDRLGFYVSAELSGKLKECSPAHALPVGLISAGSDGVPGYLPRFSRELSGRGHARAVAASVALSNTASSHSELAVSWRNI